MQVLVTHTRKRELITFNISSTLWGYSSAKTLETYTKMDKNIINSLKQIKKSCFEQNPRPFKKCRLTIDP